MTAPVLNIHNGKVKLPARHVSDTWVPLDKSVQVMETQSEVERGVVKQ